MLDLLFMAAALTLLAGTFLAIVGAKVLAGRLLAAGAFIAIGGPMLLVMVGVVFQLIVPWLPLVIVIVVVVVVIKVAAIVVKARLAMRHLRRLPRPTLRRRLPGVSPRLLPPPAIAPAATDDDLNLLGPPR